jgi:hypothetical protein
MFLKNIFLNAYSMLLSEPVHKKRFATQLMIISIGFCVAASFVTIISTSKLLFVILAITPIVNFYFCVEKEICLDSGEKPLTLINIYAIILMFCYFYIDEKIAFFLALNAYAMIKMIKNREAKLSQLSLLKNLVILVFSAFYANFSESFLYLLPVIALTFAVFVSMIKNYENFTNMNHYLCFNLMFFLPLFFSFDNQSLQGESLDLLSFAYCIGVIFIGVLQMNMLVRFLIMNDLKYVLFAINEFSLVYVAFLIRNVFIIIAMGLGTVVSFYFTDFDYRNSFIDPLNENLGNDKDLEIELQSIKDKVFNKENNNEHGEPLIKS